MKAFRGASVGGKTDMDDPNHLQMIYKWRAVLVADEVSSGESVAMEVFRDALGSNANVTMITQEHEGRWTLSYQACVAVKSLLDTKSGHSLPLPIPVPPGDPCPLSSSDCAPSRSLLLGLPPLAPFRLP